jgi:hypothetical protein
MMLTPVIVDNRLHTKKIDFTLTARCQQNLAVAGFQFTLPGQRASAEASFMFVTSKRFVRCILFQSYSYSFPHNRQI